MVNNDLIAHSNCSGLDSHDQSLLASEVISYIIIDSAVISIGSGDITPYTLDYHVKSNFAYFPKAWDAFSRAEYKQNTRRPQMYYAGLPEILSYVPIP